jgi:predicted Zn finger-like uncharacterized protein
MIIACPQCDIRFVVPSTVFARGGRKMKCAKCEHKWFQDEPLDKKEDTDDFRASLNEALDRADKEPDKQSLPQTLKSDFKEGYITIIIGFLVVIGFFFLYQSFRGPIPVGEGLVFDMIEVERIGNDIHIEGLIVNAMNDDRGVPSVKITQILNNDVKGDSIIIPIQTKILETGQNIPFVTTLNNIGPDIQNLHIEFNMDENN